MYFEYFDRYSLAKLFIKEEQPETELTNVGYVLKREGKLLVSLAQGRDRNFLYELDHPSHLPVSGRKETNEIIHGWAVRID